jgi:pyruvate,orthophosphate dikinase
MPVPEGFIVTTELFRCQRAMNYEPFQEDTRNRIEEYLTALERVSGKRFGKVRAPLLLSVRSSSVMSMPGMMSTFLNVGLNDEITETLGNREKYSWGAWDCYRRLIQSWAMSHGVDRDIFDDAIQNAKLRYGVEKKMEFSPAHMREIAYQYKEIMADHGVTLIQEPFEQLVRAIQIVLESWFSQRAEDYRQHLGIADQWGTSAIVQRMVFGNLNQQSGSGVIMTRSPIDSEVSFDLYGDYNICSQGEDVVSGLVNPLPITLSQQQHESSNVEDSSLQVSFPEIYGKLKNAASFLIEEQGYAHQEIEFTFESERIEDLYILQTRNMVFAENERIQVFVTSTKLKDSLLGRGIGAGGGALSGKVAFTSRDIQALRSEEPDCTVILVRPDTVPEDFSLIAEADGLLTARGGCTSHAAVAAQRLGKTCVVNCRSLRVKEEQQRAELNGKKFHFGDSLSIDGRQGTIYRGEFPVQFEDIVI